MCRTLLLTLQGRDTAKTFSFDERVQSVLWIGEHEPCSAAGALVCVERAGQALLVRTAAPNVRLLLAGNEQAELRSVAVERGATTMLGVLDQKSGRQSRLYIRPLAKGTATFCRYAIAQGTSLTIGRDDTCDVVYENRYLLGRHAKLSCTERGFVLEDLKRGMGTVVNGSVLNPLLPRELVAGDVISILDLTCMVGRDMVCINCPPGLRLSSLEQLAVKGTHGTTRIVVAQAGDPASSAETFYPAPRLVPSVHTRDLRVDEPPAHAKPVVQPAIVSLGPSMLMGMSSAFMLLNAVLGIARGSDMLSVLPLAGMSATMLVASVVWPTVAKSYERRRREAEELQRNHLYVSYLDSIECALEAEAQAQQDICRRRMPSTHRILDMVHERSPELMSHASGQDDFLHVRLGIGDCALDANLSWPQRKPSLHADDMWDRLQELASHPPRLRDVPIALDLQKHRVVGVIGSRALVWEMVRGVLVQLLAGCSYRELKVILVADELERDEWGWMVTLAHLQADDGSTRLVATTPEGMRRIDRMLEHRCRHTGEPDVGAEGRAPAHWVVVCANTELAKRSEVLLGISERRSCEGISLLFMASQLVSLPRSCSRIVDLRGGVPDVGLQEQGHREACSTRGACMFSREDMSQTLVAFDPDSLVTQAQARSFALDLGMIRLEATDELVAGAQAKGFLELFSVGCVEHLNIGTRWREHDPSRSLSVPLGVNGHGAPICLDLHEDGQGPHGLIAGTTGSGKSELIITLILSLCVSYAPDEVSFLIIDYKGGGLAGAFDGEGRRLPHLAGTITNLDGAAIRRTLVSLQSELRRRQRVLNDARVRTGEPTMDIRRYMSLYRQGVLSQPLSHLVVIADEFAELRQQEPEFMEELITASRIGRSLGIHLLLATQKPSGVVSDQIWSNARFKLCLKVADAMDSKEMVRRDVAAAYVRPGQFCLLVGYDEEFCEGQCAYAGGAYVPRERFEPRRDLSVELLDGEGVVVAREERSESVPGAPAELDAVLSHLCEQASLLDVRAGPLWIEPLPDSLSLTGLDRACGREQEAHLPVAIGLADDPWNQRYRRLEVDLDEVGNVLLYGAPGLGVDRWLCAVVASVVHVRPSRSPWLYGIDLGQGELASLGELPQWGGMVSLGQTERMENLLFLLERELVLRREGARDRDAQAVVPIVVALANLAAWMDEYPSLQERLESIVRDGPQFGIHLVASTGSVLGTSMRLRSHCGAEFAMRLHDEADYAMLLGGTDGASLPKSGMRGLVRLDGQVLEFVGTHATVDEIACIAQAGVPGDTLAPPPIPHLPTHVTSAHLVDRASSRLLPIGLLKAGAQPLCVSVDPSRPLVVAGDDPESLGRLVEALASMLARDAVRHVVVGAARESGVPASLDPMARPDECQQLVCALADGSCEQDVVVLSNVLKLMETLPAPAAEQLKEALSRPAHARRTTLVLVMEGWRAASVYEPWLKACISCGPCVWVGNGLLAQTLFALVTPSSAYRKVLPAMDGYVLDRGLVQEVRLVEPNEGVDAHG
ncbi:MAG: FtsK/SpoIIIE domain-containing protein [Coriobacteriales bacterium]|nr:FtsK/SpoIIIE domain-containing protein [Coriobacteriales bacterium]